MKHLATIFADSYRKRNWLPATTIDCMEYTLRSFFNEISKWMLYCVIFFLVHKLPEFLISYLVFISIRLFAGGIHCKTYWGCFFLSFVLIGVCIMAPHFISINGKALTTIAMASSVCPLILAPVTPSFRTIKGKRNRIKLRILSFTTTILWILLANYWMRDTIFLPVVLNSIIIVNYQLVFWKAKTSKKSHITE